MKKKYKKTVNEAGKRPISNEHMLVVVIAILICVIGLLISR